MKVLVADKFERSGIEGLKAAGCEVIYEPDLKDAALADALKRTAADVLVVRSTNVTEPMLDSGSLALIVRAGAGYNTIDVKAASRRGIYVSNCPGKNSIAVAELAFALILAVDRRIPDNVADLRAGKWDKKEYSKAAGLFGRTLALIGIGNIGREMIRRAAGFGMNVVIWSRRFDGEDRPLSDDEARELGVDPLQHQIAISLAPTPAEAAARANVISLHVALAPGTRTLVNAELLARVRPGAILVNTARGEVLDYAAVADAVRTRGLRVALDVYAAEPASATGVFADPLVQLPGVYGTHHIGASTDQAQEAIAAETVRIIRSFKETGEVPNVVNLCRRTPASHMLIVRHRDRPGVLAHVFDHLRSENINVQETENIVFDGAEAAIARINVDAPPNGQLLDRLRRGNVDILDLRLVAL
ncbi:MAG TPA: 3-phosphoglycerate dehydrogenase family protein [Vicinamibacterales bacterium]|jgi:D-3-phosphoglycerate dehydrogenase|nr:3-phosphoglycerate dehydrogenase family protein [Vicinamibacterales bacterium]